MTPASSPPPRAQRPCATCGRPFPLPTNNPRKRYCTPRCRVADWHHRNRTGRQPAAPAPAPSTEKANGVPNGVPTGNAVPNAVTRCPHCSEPVAVISLLVTPAAAHIATPPAADAARTGPRHPNTPLGRQERTMPAP